MFLSRDPEVVSSCKKQYHCTYTTNVNYESTTTFREVTQTWANHVIFVTKMNWQDAFFKQYQDAATGRLVRGIVHNLNGVNQAFFLQATLFKSMFEKSHKLIECIQSGIDPENSLVQLKDLLHNRSVMAEQMEEKVAVSNDIVKRIQPIMEMYQVGEDQGVSISAIADIEMDFLYADSFFKHKINKQCDIASNLTIDIKVAFIVHLLIYTLFVNAIEALQGVVDPKITFKVFRDDDNIFFELYDNGCGVDSAIAETIFQPFVTSKNDQLGVGLYILSEQVSALGGVINWRVENHTTLFYVSLPLAGL